MLIPRTEVIQKVPLNYPPTYPGQILGRGRAGAAKSLCTRSSVMWCNILAKMENGTTLRYHPTHPWASFPLPLIALCSKPSGNENGDYCFNHHLQRDRELSVQKRDKLSLHLKRGGSVHSSVHESSLCAMELKQTRRKLE